MTDLFHRIRLTEPQLEALEESRPTGKNWVLFGTPIRRGWEGEERQQVNLCVAWVEPEQAIAGLEAAGVAARSQKERQSIKRKQARKRAKPGKGGKK